MQGVVEADLGDRGAGDRREQRAPERVAERVAEAGVERADGEPLTVLLLLADGLDGGALDDEHRMAPAVVGAGGGGVGYFE